MPKRKPTPTVSTPNVNETKDAATSSSQSWFFWLVVCWVALVHLAGFQGDFLFDDRALLDNESLRDFWSFDWFRLTKRPVSYVTYAASFAMFGESAFGFHVLNWLIHIGCTCVVFLLVQRTLRTMQMDEKFPRSIATAVALIWGVHPLTTSAVTYIIQRAESLATFWMLCCMFAWLCAFSKAKTDQECAISQRSSTILAGLAIVAAWLAYGSKEMSAGLPFIIAFFDRAFIATTWSQVRKRWLWYALLVAPIVLGMVLILPRLVNSTGRGTIGFSMEGITPMSYFLSQPRVFCQYLWLTVFPVNQTLDYGWLPPRDTLSKAFGVVGWSLIAVTLIWLSRKRGKLAFLLASSLLVLAPTSTFVPLQDIIFEHRFYFPLAFLLAGLFACSCVRLSQRFVLTVAIAVAVPLSLLTITRCMDYSSPLLMMQHDVKNQPSNPRTWASLAFKSSDRPDQAIDMLRHAIELSQQRDYFYAGTDYKWPREIADIFFLHGKMEEAQKWYLEALPHSYDDLQESEIHFSLAMIASLQGRNNDADQRFKAALEKKSPIAEKVRAAYDAHKRRLSTSNQPIEPPSGQRLPQDPGDRQK